MSCLESRFDADYDHFVWDVMLADEEKNAQEARYAAQLAKVSPGNRVLDVPCGVGRLTTHLTSLGSAVIGADLSIPYVSRAQHRNRASRPRPSFVLADMAALPFRDTFDAVICWFISLGYYSEDFDRSFLKETARCLKPGGSLVIEAVNPVGMLLTRADSQGEFIDETWVGNSLMSLHLRYDPVGGKNDVERLVFKDGITRRHQFSVRLYTPSELRLMLEQCGFKVTQIVNAYAAPLSVSDERMYIVAARCG